MSITIKATNYRALLDVAWTIPDGLSVVAGANGAGKTTLLFATDILRRAVDEGSSGLGAALEHYNIGYLRSFGTSPDAPISLGVETGGVSWTIEPHPEGGGIAESPAERLVAKGDVIFERAAGDAAITWRGKTVTPRSRTLIRRLMDLDTEGTFPGKTILDALNGYHVHYDLDLRGLRRGSPDSNHRTLHPNGVNAFTVLRNWRDWSGDAFRYEHVIESLRECFGFFDKLDFQRGGSIIEGYLIHRGQGAGVPVPASICSNGWLAALGHFTAVASADPGDVVAIDEIENGLHPRAVHQALKCIDSFAAWRGISVVLATQSTEVLNWFDHRPERVFIMDGRTWPSPRPLTDLRSAEWLQHFRLGEKYAEGDLGDEGERP